MPLLCFTGGPGMLRRCLCYASVRLLPRKCNASMNSRTFKPEFSFTRKCDSGLLTAVLLEPFVCPVLWRQFSSPSHDGSPVLPTCSTPPAMQLLPCLLTLALPPAKTRINPVPTAVAAAVAGGTSAGTTAGGGGRSDSGERYSSQRATETTPLLSTALEERV